MYSNELLRTKIVGQLASAQIVWQERGVIGIDRPFRRRKVKFESEDSSAVRTPSFKAVRRVPAVRAGQGLPLRLCAFARFAALRAASLREHRQGRRQGPLGRMPAGRNPDPFGGKPGFAARQPLCGCADARIQRDDEC